MNGLGDLFWRIRRLIGRGRGILQDDTGPVQLVQLQPSNLETFDQMPRVAEYGFQSAPPDGWDGVAVFFSGDRSSGVVIATNHQQFRVRKLAKGEVCISDNQGQQIYFKNGGGILMTDKAGSTVNMNGDGTGTMTFQNGLTINGAKITGAGDVVNASGISLGNHTHLYTPGTSSPTQTGEPTG